MSDMRFQCLCCIMALVVALTSAISYENEVTYPFSWSDVGSSSSSPVPLGCKCNEVGVSEKQCKKVECSCVCNVMAGKRSEEHTSELQSLMRTSYATFCMKNKKL